MWRHQPPPPTQHNLQPTTSSQRGISGRFRIRHPGQQVGVHGRQFRFQRRTRGAFRRLHRAAHGLSHAAQMKRPATRDSDQKIYGVLVRGEIRLLVEKGKGARIKNCRSNCSVALHTRLRFFHRSIPSQEPSGRSRTTPSPLTPQGANDTTYAPDPSLTCPPLTEAGHLPSPRSVYHNCWQFPHQAHPSCCPLPAGTSTSTA